MDQTLQLYVKINVNCLVLNFFIFIPHCPDIVDIWKGGCEETLSCRTEENMEMSWELCTTVNT